MWSEVGGGGGAVNFITGMGGFLQAREREQLRDYKTTYLIFVRTNIRDYKTKHTGGALRLSWSESEARPFGGFELSSQYTSHHNHASRSCPICLHLAPN